MESLVQGKLARRVRWGGCRNVRSEKLAARCVLTQSFRERLATLTRKSRHAASRIQALHSGMYLIGCSYNFCWPHQQLSKAKHRGQPCTPAMASGLTDHVWRVGELLMYQVAPAPWIEPSRPRPARKRPVSDPEPTKRAKVRLRKGVLCPVTT